MDQQSSKDWKFPQSQSSCGIENYLVSSATMLILSLLADSQEPDTGAATKVVVPCIFRTNGSMKVGFHTGTHAKDLRQLS